LFLGLLRSASSSQSGFSAGGARLQGISLRAFIPANQIFWVEKGARLQVSELMITILASYGEISQHNHQSTIGKICKKNYCKPVIL